MNFAFSVLASSATALALQTNISAPDLFYSPDIKIETQDSGWSLYGCKTEEVEIYGLDPVDKNLRSISVTVYQSSNAQTKKAVIIVPPTGGVNIIDQGYANKLCSNGITVALLNGWEHQLDVSLDLKMHDNGALRYLSAIRHTVEFLEDRSLTSIGLLGTSIGAIGGSLAFGIDERISAATFIVGSGRFADVVAYSDEKGATKLRELRMKLFDLESIEQYRDLLEKSITIEPSKYLNEARTRPSLVIVADKDTTVPSEYQNELANALASERIDRQGSHLQVIKDTYWYESEKIVSFFNNKLKGI